MYYPLRDGDIKDPVLIKTVTEENDQIFHMWKEVYLPEETLIFLVQKSWQGQNFKIERVLDSVFEEPALVQCL